VHLLIQLTEKDIINNCRSITFNRGSEYYSKNNVSFISSDLIKNNYDMSVVNIDAAVWGSYGSLYDVVISFNERKRFLHLYCDCEYHHSTGDMCKHMVAVLLKYIKIKERVNEMNEKKKKTISGILWIILALGSLSYLIYSIIQLVN